MNGASVGGDMETTQTLESSRSLPCPRCGGGREGEEYYGVCTSCAAALRSSLGGQQRDVAAAEYEPKMNVTPNAVASKE